MCRGTPDVGTRQTTLHCKKVLLLLRKSYGCRDTMRVHGLAWASYFTLPCVRQYVDCFKGFGSLDVPGLVVCRRFGHSAAWNNMRCIGMFPVVPGLLLHGLQG